MKEADKENLLELFERFLSEADARKAAEDIRRGEELLSEYPAPEPTPEVLAGIKRRIAQRLEQKESRARKHAFAKAVAVAAVFAIVGFVSLKLFVRPVQPQAGSRASLLPSEVWDSEDIVEADAELLTLVSQVDEIEDELFTLETDGTGREEHPDIDDIEADLMELDSEFWSG